MKDDENQPKVFEFLLAHLVSKAAFTREELIGVTD